ncbi:MAG: hypothetical protein JW860_07820, partial [Sedimentisphaerales bacterium]|nr:hypothetical protein [Sedimentisphaerales bacterium]
TDLFPIHLRYAEDIALWLQVAYRWPRIGYVNEPLAIWNLENRPDSLYSRVDPFERVEVLNRLYQDHKELAAHYQKLEALNRYMASRMRQWLYVVYRRREFARLKQFLADTEIPVSPRYKSLMNCLCSCPRWTRFIGKRILRLSGYHP